MAICTIYYLSVLRVPPKVLISNIAVTLLRVCALSSPLFQMENKLSSWTLYAAAYKLMHET